MKVFFVSSVNRIKEHTDLLLAELIAAYLINNGQEGSTYPLSATSSTLVCL